MKNCNAAAECMVLKQDYEALKAAAKRIIDLVDLDTGNPDYRPRIEDWSTAIYRLRLELFDHMDIHKNGSKL